MVPTRRDPRFLLTFFLTLALLAPSLAACGSTTASVNQAIAMSTATAIGAAGPGAPPRTTPSVPPLAAATMAPTPVVTRPPGAAASTAPAGAAPAVSAAPAASAAPAVPAASAGAVPPSAAVPQPNGTLPPGWQVYRGPSAFPIIIAYPPDWTVDDSLYPGQLIISLVGPHNGQDEEQRVDIEPAYNGDGANIDVQRDDYYYRKTEFCDQKGIEYTERRQVSGSAFAILGATCDQANVLYFLQVASGVTGGDEWNISLRGIYDRKEEHRAIFDPMLASINVYGRLQR